MVVDEEIGGGLQKEGRGQLFGDVLVGVLQRRLDLVRSLDIRYDCLCVLLLIAASACSHVGSDFCRRYTQAVMHLYDYRTTHAAVLP